MANMDSGVVSDTEMELNQKLPFDHLLILFTYIPTEDLVSAQRVCHGWRAAAQHKSLWKNFKLTVTGTQEDERKIRIMPALRNIDGNANNSFMNLIMENIIELSQMNVTFTPPLSSAQVLSMHQKYPGIESVTLDICAPDIVESVKVLKTSQQLKLVKFFVTNSDKYSGRVSLSSLSKIYSIVADGENFPALTNIDASDVIYCIPTVKDPAFVNFLIDIIRKKSQQLSLLKVIVCNTENENFINAINMCTKLHTLRLILLEDYIFEHPVCINIHRMSQLRSLSFAMSDSSRNLLPLYSCIYMGSWLHLQKLDLILSTSSQPNLCILRAVIENMKHLVELCFCDHDRNISERELTNIGCLFHLEKLQVNGLHSLSEEGINYISECQDLLHLMLYGTTTSINNVNIVNMINKMKKLENWYFSFLISELHMMLSDREEIDKFISENLVQP